MRDFLIIILNKMANETWPQGPSEKLQSIMDWLSNEEKKQMLELLLKEAWEKEINSESDSNLWENFEKLDLGAKVDRIFEKLWDTDDAADKIIDLIMPHINWYWEKSPVEEEISRLEYESKYKQNILRSLFQLSNFKKFSEDDGRNVYLKIKDKFWTWPVGLRIMLFILDDFDKIYRNIWMHKAFKEDKDSKKNVTEKTLKAFLDGSNWAKDIAKNYLR